MKSKIIFTLAVLLFMMQGCEEKEKQVTNFEECAKAGNPIMESYPRQCRDGDQLFTEVIEQQVCENHCGNGECEEIVCQAVGCPCAESVESCPPDCAPNDTNEDKKYITSDPDKCALIRFQCTEGREPFFDEGGCGCQVVDSTMKPVKCTQRSDICTKEYRPVCGWFNESIRCIKAPCAQTYGNSCEACSNPMVESWTLGSCRD